MSNDTLKTVGKPEETLKDPLTELLRNGARELIRQAVESELMSLLSEHEHLKLLDGRQALVRNGYLPERTIQTGIGDVRIQVPKIRDRSGSGIHFISQLLPPYLKRTKSKEYPLVITLKHCVPYWVNQLEACPLILFLDSRMTGFMNMSVGKNKI